MSEQFQYSIAMEPEPTPQEKALLDQFLDQYFIDYNALEACIRVGFQETFAMEYAKRFMWKPYVVRKIAEHRNTLPKDVEKADDADKALVLATLRELAQNGKGAQRTAAALGLARIKGMDVQPDKAGEALQQLADDFANLAQKLPD